MSDPGFGESPPLYTYGLSKHSNSSYWLAGMDLCGMVSLDGSVWYGLPIRYGSVWWD